MKVIHVVGSLDISAGGPSRSVPQTCESLSKLGVEIELITRPSINPVSLNLNKNFKVKFLGYIGLMRKGFALNKKEVSLIHLQHVWDPYIHVMAFFARLKGIPYIITPRGMLEPWIMNNNPWKKRIGMLLYQKKDLKKADCIHTTCELEKSNVENLGFTNYKTIIPNGVVLDEVKSVKAKYGTKRIVFLSRIHPKKGIEILVEAWSTITTDWEIEIAGDGDKDYISKLKETIAAKKIKGITFVGPQYGEDKWNFIRSADLFVLPTYSENFGIVVAEALAVGVPVITTNGTPWEELNTLNCGMCIELSVENLKKSLEQMMALSQEELIQMGQNGIQLINSKYSVNQVADSVLNMYNETLKALG